MFESRKNSKPENYQKKPQNPTCRVHALLGNLLTCQNAGRKKTPPPTWLSFTHNFDFDQNQKNFDLQKRSPEKRILKNETADKPEQSFSKTWHNQKTTTPTQPR